jgi:Flp pilus assembly protein TadD
MEMNRQGESCFASGAVAEAESFFRAAIERDPYYATPLNNMAVLCWGRGDAAAAVDYLKKAVKIDPRDESVAANVHEIQRALKAGANEACP